MLLLFSAVGLAKQNSETGDAARRDGVGQSEISDRGRPTRTPFFNAQRQRWASQRCHSPQIAPCFTISAFDPSPFDTSIDPDSHGSPDGRSSIGSLPIEDTIPLKKSSY